MTDADLDQRLREHGAAWRAEHQQRPAVDWAALRAPRPRRVWLAAAGVATAAAAVIIPVAILAGGPAQHSQRPPSHRSPSPSPSPSPPPPPAVARRGAPPGFFSTESRTMIFWARGATWGVTLPHRRAVAVAAAPSGLTGYGAFAGSSCDTLVESATFDPSRGEAGQVGRSAVVTLRGVAAATPMAVSPDGRMLALVLSRRLGSGGCRPAARLAVVDLATKAITTYRARPGQTISSPQWSADSAQLAVGLGSNPSPARRGLGPPSRTVLLDTPEAGPRNLDSPSYPVLVTHRYSATPQPVLWWKRQWVVAYHGELRQITSDGRYGAVLASGLPEVIDSVSSDPSGNHLLVGSGAATYRWDRGLLSRVRRAPPGLPSW